MATTGALATGRSDGSDWVTVALRWSVRALVAIVWISAAIFATYIVALFLGAVVIGAPDEWNDSLPRLYVARSAPANIGIGVHFALGALLLLLGPVQLIAGIRAKWPALHRWTGRVYAGSAFLTGLGGLSYILLRGTIGGATMDVGFGVYGALMMLASAQTVRHAMARRIDLHRAWAIRLFALTIGSWLYRMDYGFWMLFAGRLGRTESFTGWFDVFMIFWFYVPNLIVAELFIRARGQHAPGWAQGAAALSLAGASAFLTLATFFFTMRGWGPVILSRL